MRYKSLLILLLFITICSCKMDETSPKTTTIEREGKPTIYGVRPEDESMKKATQSATKTLHEFKKALISNNTGYSGFSLKMKFDTGTNNANGAEHIWISEIEMIDNEYVGFVANNPEFTKQVQYGDRIQVDKKRITDWK